MELGLKDKIVLITASTNGIGKATAELFLQEGAVVFINGRDDTKLLKVQEEFAGKYGKGKIHIFCGDVSDGRVIDDVCEYIEKMYGKLDILVSNLGTGKPVEKNRLAISEWQHMMNINVYSAVKVIDKGYELLKKGDNPCIIMLSSIVAFEKMNAPYAYAAAKASVLTLVKYLSKDYAKDNIRVNGVAPGNVLFEGGRWEELMKENIVEVTNYIKNNVPLQRFGRAEEIASAIVFLASERSLFTTGETLVVDGGQKRG